MPVPIVEPGFSIRRLPMILQTLGSIVAQNARAWSDALQSVTHDSADKRLHGSELAANWLR
ncbi:MAG TPA: hypothetical protein VFY96_06945 [Candidatus Binatia bacterium]|nr:hypothetical protein [Candidatus Binatia bacterium]